MSLDDNTPNCPECDHGLASTDPVRLRQIVECPACRRELEVIATEPMILVLAPDLEDRWGE